MSGWVKEETPSDRQRISGSGSDVNVTRGLGGARHFMSSYYEANPALSLGLAEPAAEWVCRLPWRASMQVGAGPVADRVGQGVRRVQLPP